MKKADDDASTPTPQEVLDALHEAVPSLRTSLAQVTPAVETLAQQHSN